MTDQVPDHTDFDELAAGHVLHALEHAEEQRFLRHAEQCPRCEQTVAEFRAVAATLAQTAPHAEPGARLGERIMAVARADLAEPGRAAAPAGPGSTDAGATSDDGIGLDAGTGSTDPGAALDSGTIPFASARAARTPAPPSMPAPPAPPGPGSADAGITLDDGTGPDSSAGPEGGAGLGDAAAPGDGTRPDQAPPPPAGPAPGRVVPLRRRAGRSRVRTAGGGARRGRGGCRADRGRGHLGRSRRYLGRTPAAAGGVRSPACVPNR